MSDFLFAGAMGWMSLHVVRSPRTCYWSLVFWNLMALSGPKLYIILRHHPMGTQVSGGLCLLWLNREGELQNTRLNLSSYSFMMLIRSIIFLMITIDILKNMVFAKNTVFSRKPGNLTHIQEKHCNSFSTLKKVGYWCTRYIFFHPFSNMLNYHLGVSSEEFGFPAQSIHWYLLISIDSLIPVRYGHPLQCTHQQFCCEGNGRWLLGQALEDPHMHSWFMIYVDGLIRLRMVELSPTKTHRNLRNHKMLTKHECTHFGWISVCIHPSLLALQEIHWRQTATALLMMSQSLTVKTLALEIQTLDVVSSQPGKCIDTRDRSYPCAVILVWFCLKIACPQVPKDCHRYSTQLNAIACCYSMYKHVYNIVRYKPLKRHYSSCMIFLYTIWLFNIAMEIHHFIAR